MAGRRFRGRRPLARPQAKEMKTRRRSESPRRSKKDSAEALFSPHTAAAGVWLRVMAEDLETWFVREILSHERSLTRYLLRVWRNRDEVPDLRQEAYVRVFDAARVQRPGSPKAFLFTTARHLMTDRLRRARIIFIGAQGEVEALNFLVDETSPERRLTGIEELRLLAGAFDRLPERCRAVMWLRKVEQVSQKDVAVRLGIQEKAVEKQVARGMRLLARMLLGGDEGGKRTDHRAAESGEEDHG